MDEAKCGTQFSFTKDAMRGFMAQCICSIALSQSIKALTPTSDSVAVSFCWASIESLKRFGTVHNPVINNRKMAAQNAFSSSLVYLHIFSSVRTKRTNAKSNLRLDEMKEVVFKLHVIGKYGI